MPMIQGSRSKWEAEIKSEVEFWDAFFRTKGLQWADAYRRRLDPDLPLQPRPAALLPTKADVQILDVGAGPLTYLGKKYKNESLSITAVDPLSDEYDKILNKYRVRQLVRTQRLAAENLTKRFDSNTYDLVFARNSIDHSYNPERAVLQMIEVAKRSSFVLLEHGPNEAERANYSGLHQWNFSLSEDDDLIISSRSERVNITQKYKSLCSVSCELISKNEKEKWLIARIHKK